jgi:hypothetical protein
MVIRVLCSGQSNAHGRGKGGPSFSGVSPRLTAWNNVNPLGADGTAFVVPTLSNPTFDPNAGNNFGLWFCHHMAHELDVDVRYTLVAQGGSSIGLWVTGDGTSAPMRDEIVSVWAVSAQPPADVFLWHQGESDLAMSDADYATYFNELIGYLRSNNIIAATAPVLIGGIYEAGATEIAKNTALEALAGTDPYFAYVPSTGLRAPDSLHFDGDCLFDLGYTRYWQAYKTAAGFPGIIDFGIGVKDVLDSAEYSGVFPPDTILTAAMISAGAMVEFGTTPSGGSYTRFESGLQICWGRHSAVTLTSNASGSLFYGAIIAFTFARPFVSIPMVTPTADKSAGGSLLVWGCFGGSNSPNRTGCSVSVVGSAATAGAIPGYIAIGFWK